MHRALRPGGVLLDVHPEPELARLEVAGPRGAAVVGPLREPTRPGRVLTARHALEGLVAAGYFALVRAEVFTFLSHFDSAAAWRAYVAERWSSAEVDDADERRLAAALSSTRGEVLIRERVRAAAYARTEPA